MTDPLIYTDPVPPAELEAGEKAVIALWESGNKYPSSYTVARKVLEAAKKVRDEQQASD